MGLDKESINGIKELIQTIKDFRIVGKIEIEIPNVIKISLDESPSKVLSKQEKEEVKKEYESKVKPNDVIEAFAKEIEEFYPYGREKTDNNQL